MKDAEKTSKFYCKWWFSFDKPDLVFFYVTNRVLFYPTSHAVKTKMNKSSVTCSYSKIYFLLIHNTKKIKYILYILQVTRRHNLHRI